MQFQKTAHGQDCHGSLVHSYLLLSVAIISCNVILMCALIIILLPYKLIVSILYGLYF